MQNSNNTQNQKVYANYWIRLLATAIDASLLILIWLLAGYILSLKVTAQPESGDLLLPLLLNKLLIFLAFSTIYWVLVNNVLYDSITTSKFGGTLGKLMLGLRVEDALGNNLSYKRAFFRYTVGYAVAGLLWGFGFFWILKDDKHQGWHDQITGSYVVKKGSNYLTVLAVLTLLALSAVNSAIVFAIFKNLSSKEIKNEISAVLENIKQEKTSSKEKSTKQPENGITSEEKDKQEIELLYNEIQEIALNTQTAEQTPAPETLWEMTGLANDMLKLSKSFALNYQSVDNLSYAGDNFYLFASLGACGALDWASGYYDKALELDPQNTTVRENVEALKMAREDISYNEMCNDPLYKVRSNLTFPEASTEGLEEYFSKF